MQSTEFEGHVRRRLEAWGRDYRLACDLDFLAYGPKNILQVLIEHRGEIPQGGGFRRTPFDSENEEIEILVSELAREEGFLAACIRAYYCGEGRRGVERYELARDLCAHRLSRAQYYRHVHAAQDWISANLMLRARAA